MKVLVTGAAGFIGGRLVEALAREGVSVIGMMRRSSAPGEVVTVRADLLDVASLERACAGMDTVIHCAGYAHAFDTPGKDAALRHHEINFVGTRNLAQAARCAGVRRFVFLSSVKAMGAPGDRCVDEQWPALPETPYGIAKRKAEVAVLEAGRDSPMQVTNLRLAMVYGRGSRGNLERMAHAIQRGWFPPLPETGCRRSLVHAEDVVDAVRCVVSDERAAGRTYIVAHSRCWSGAEIHAALRAAAGRPPAAWRLPAAVLRAGGRVGDVLARVGVRRIPLDSATVERLLGAECYRADAIGRELGWQARIGLEEGCRELFGATDVRAVRAHAAVGGSAERCE